MMFQEGSHRLRLTSLPDTLLAIFIVNQRHDVCTNTTPVPSGLFLKGQTANCFPPLKDRPCLRENERVLRRRAMRKSLIQVFGFLLSTLGWLFVSCTLAMDYWRVLFVGGKGGSWMIKSSWYWSNLWKDCVMDTSSVTNCRDYDVLWAVTPYVQAVRGLLMAGMSLGFVAAVLCFIGMDCTYIGGSAEKKDKILFSGAAFHFVGGVSALAAYCLYTNRVASTAFSPTVDRSIIRYGIGTPIFLGLAGNFLIILGSILYAVTVISTRMLSAFAARAEASPSYGQRTASKSLYAPAYRAPSGPSSGSRGSSVSRGTSISRATGDKIHARDTFV